MSPVLLLKSINLSKCIQFNVTFISIKDGIQATLQVRELKNQNSALLPLLLFDFTTHSLTVHECGKRHL